MPEGLSVRATPSRGFLHDIAANSSRALSRREKKGLVGHRVDEAGDAVRASRDHAERLAGEQRRRRPCAAQVVPDVVLDVGRGQGESRTSDGDLLLEGSVLGPGQDRVQVLLANQQNGDPGCWILAPADLLQAGDLREQFIPEALGLIDDQQESAASCTGLVEDTREGRIEGLSPSG
jgi:hypothetical protein